MEPNITRALDGVDFSVAEGEFTAVVGTSGSGKSTLLHMCGGLDVPTAGDVIVSGQNLSQMNDEELTILDVYKRQIQALPFCPVCKSEPAGMRRYSLPRRKPLECLRTLALLNC